MPDRSGGLDGILFASNPNKLLGEAWEWEPSRQWHERGQSICERDGTLSLYCQQGRPALWDQNEGIHLWTVKLAGVIKSGYYCEPNLYIAMHTYNFPSLPSLFI